MRIALAVSVALVWGTASADHFDDVVDKVRSTTPVTSADLRKLLASTADGLSPSDDDPPAVPARPAQARDRDVPPGPPPPPPIVPLDPVRFQRELHLRLGSATVDGQSIDYKAGVAIAGGVHFHDFQLLGEYAIAGVEYNGAYTSMPARGGITEITDTNGIEHRFGLAARYQFAWGTTALDADGEQQDGGLWLEAGAGEEIYQWDKGGVLRRPDLELGIGLQGALRTSRHHRGGLDVGIRVQFAHRSDLAGAPATCSAPCTEATPPATWGDRAYFLDVGFLLGG